MKSRLTAILCLLTGLLLSNPAYAQPVLPALSGTADSGLVLLSWVCQYDGVRAIAVKRSGDSMGNYKTIGYVKNTGKGVQAFADGHPEVGNNYYKLNIVFNSGLNWGSNFCRVFVDATRAVVPGNDSLQHFIVVEEITHHETEINSTDSKGVARHYGPKVAIVFPELDMEDATFIVSKYVVVNKLTGHVTITLPDDFRKCDYSIKFYNSKKKMIMDIPVLKQSPAILDKRNFQRRGMYKFVLRKDWVELESGYVNIGL